MDATSVTRVIGFANKVGKVLTKLVKQAEALGLDVTPRKRKKRKDSAAEAKPAKRKSVRKAKTGPGAASEETGE